MTSHDTISPFPPEHVAIPVMFQCWQQITFLHWAYEPALIRGRLPKELELDTFGGVAWISLTPFIVEDLRPPFLPALPWLSRFPETNARTYVRGPDGNRGVWFFSLDAARLFAVMGAKMVFSLPYKWAHMTVAVNQKVLQYRSRRQDAMSDIEVEIGEKLQPSPLDNFLTARYRLYTIRSGTLRYAQVEHPPWPLFQAHLRRVQQTILSSNHLPPPQGNPIVHFSPGVSTRVGALRSA